MNELEKAIEIRKKEQNKSLDKYQKIYDMLTPETCKRELINILHKLENITDPRIYNCPLPNDSVPTKQFGPISYIFDGYPGFVWRLGVWYKIIPQLKFPTISIEEEEQYLYNPFVKGDKYKENEPDVTMLMDYAYYPIKIDGVRVFFREYWNKFNKYDGDKIVKKNIIVETAMYLPETQAFLPCIRNRIELANEPNVIFEDPEYIARLFSKM